MSSADSKTRRQREGADRPKAQPAPEPVDAKSSAEGNGQAQPEGPLGAEIFGDDQDPFEYFGDEQGRQLEEGSFEYTLHSSSPKAEQRAPRRVATPEGRRIEKDGQEEDRPLSPEDNGRWRGAIEPVSRRRCTKRCTHARLTSYFAATASASIPASHARNTRFRKSIEYAVIAPPAEGGTMAEVLRTSEKRSSV